MTFHVGEIRQVGIEVINQLQDDFVIDVAEYKVIDQNGAELEQGYPTIEGHKLITLFNANEIGRYYVVFKYHVGPEILKAKIYVEVVR